MNLPRSLAYERFKNSEPAVIMQGTVWNITKEREGENYLRWHTKIFGLAKENTLRTLEEDYMEFNEKNIKKFKDEKASQDAGRRVGAEDIELADFMINGVVRRGKGEEKKTSCALEEVLQKMFFCNETFYEISETRNQNHEIRMGRKSYSINKWAMQLNDMEKKYAKKLEQRITTYEGSLRGKTAAKILENKYYNGQEKIGFQKTSRGFFAYTKIESYALHERNNNKHYGFGEAEVGTQLELTNGEVVWHDPVVMNHYMHPGLPGEGTYQKICPGKFSYDKIRRDYGCKAQQIRLALEEARRMIERGYFSRGGSWNSLNDPRYAAFEIENLEGWRVTNT